MTEVAHYRTASSTGRLLERILEHDFDCRHYRVDPGSINVEVREGLKILEAERTKWERETRERQQQQFEERQRVQELQRKQGQRGF